MATTHLHLKGLRTDNILLQIINNEIHTDYGSKSLAFLPENTDIPSLSSVDKVLIPVFRRFNYVFIKAKKQYDRCWSAVNYEDSFPNLPAKRLRLHYDKQPADGLVLLLDLMPLNCPSARTSSLRPIDQEDNGSRASISGIIRQRREPNRPVMYLPVSGNSSRMGEIDGEVERPERGDGSNDDFATQVAKRFISLGGLPFVISLLLRGTNQKPKFTTDNISKPPELVVKDFRTKRLCLEVLSRLCCLNSKTAELLNEHQELFAFCFHCLASNILRESASNLIEFLLMARSEVLNLCSIPMLKEVLRVLDGKKLASVCRILAVTVSDLDMMENKQTLLAQNQLKRSTHATSVREINQELIVSVPGLLTKIVQVAVNKNYLPRFPNSSTEIDHWMRFIDDSISDAIANDLEGSTNLLPNTLGLDHESSVSRSNPSLMNTNEGPVFQEQLHTNISGMRLSENVCIEDHLLQVVEALYVLSLLLIGKNRKQIQKQLSELELIPKLSNMMDSICWKTHSARTRAWSLAGHFSGCECSPEVAVKIQFLRLLHSFCDQNEEHKHLLLTPCEFDELRRIQPPRIPHYNSHHSEDKSQAGGDTVCTTSFSSELSPSFQFTTPQAGPSMESSLHPNKSFFDIQSLANINPHLMCRGTQGLLTKIVEAVKKEPSQSTFRFWLCRAIESFLRGRVSYADQIFLLRRGLLQQITTSIINTEHRTIQHEVIQSSFDLLGEMVKFNIDACKQLDSLLNTEAKLKKTMILVNDNLIDSNMFIRAMVLAADQFVNDYSSESDASHFALNSRIFAFFRDFDKHVNFVISLIGLVNVNVLTQENVSCLNTSLVILMLNRKRDNLAEILKEISQEKGTYGMIATGHESGKGMLENLRKLLKFWQVHYLHKDKDCTQLEKSSRIPFEYWKSTVEILTDGNPHNNLSLNCYINAS